MLTQKNGFLEETAYYDSESLKKLSFSLPVGVLAVNNLRIEWCNPAFQQIFDPKSTVAFAGKNIRSLSNSSSDEKRLRNLLINQTDFADSTPAIVKCNRQNGAVFLALFTPWHSWKSVSGLKQVLFIQEISDTQLRNVVETSADPVENLFSQDVFEGSLIIVGSRIVHANDRLHEMLGYPKGFLIGLAHWKIYHSDFQTEQRERVIARLCSDQQISSYQLWLEKSDGSLLIAFGIDKKIVFDGQTALSINLRDISRITDPKSDRVLRQITRNVESVSGNVANEFNNILMIITGCAQLMNHDPEITPWQQKNLLRLTQAAERVNELVKQILSPSQLIQPRMGLASLSSIIDQITNFLKNALPEQIEFFHRIETDLDVDVRLDENIQNELSLKLPDFAREVCKLNRPLLFTVAPVAGIHLRNSIRYPVEIDRTILLEITVVQPSEENSSQPGMKFQATDSGSSNPKPTNSQGMAPSEMEESHTELPKFSITVEASGSSGKHLFPEMTRALHGTERILLVDDDHNVIDTIKQMLEPLGYKVTASHGSMEALNTFRNSPQAFDLVLTDLAMPIMTGLFLASELIKLRPNIPIIILTGYIADISIKEAKSMGINTVLIKPFSQRRLVSAIRKTFDNL